jgi:hypothetical protein
MASMRLLLMAVLTMALLTVALATQDAVAQSGVTRAAGGEFSGVKTYWAEQREGCQPMISLTVKNPSSGDIGPIELRMEVMDKDKNAVFARGSASILATELRPGHTKELAIGGDHDIALHDCRGDMHEMAFSTIHFTVRLTATASRDTAGAEIVRDEPMGDEVVSAQD